eukprot:1990957-Amphidinium_carterae.1
MTSKLWWTKTADLLDDGVLGGTLARAPGATRAGTSGASAGASAEEQSFRSMSPWRNLVRAWEMRNHEKLKTNSWREVANWIDQHPADMSILTQGAMMTPTVMLEGRWDTWAYADLMVPDSRLSMLQKDCEGHDSIAEEKKEARLQNVIRPLLDPLGFRLTGKTGMEWQPANGQAYYNLMRSRVASLQKKVRIPDPSLFINHEMVHLIAQLPECDQSVRHWDALAQSGVIYDADTMDPPFNQDPGIKQALLRYQTLPLQGLVRTVTDWQQHESYTEQSIYDLDVWLRPTKRGNVEMNSTYPGRTPLTFVRSTTPTRKKVDVSDSPETETKRRRVEDDSAQSQDQADVQMGSSSSDVL